MKITDLQSLILSAIVVFGFSICGIIGILDNYVIVSVLILLFLLVIANLFTNKHFFDTDEDTPEETDIEDIPFNSDDFI